MSLCKDCKNNVIAINGNRQTFINCFCGIEKPYDIQECSHFEERLKDNSKHFDEAKQTANKGKKPRKQPKRYRFSPKVRKELNTS